MTTSQSIRYCIQDLVKECCNRLVFLMTNGNICKFLQASHLYDREFLFKYAVEYFRQNKKACMQGEGWVKLAANADLLNAILEEM
jgi:hypothetical protein